MNQFLQQMNKTGRTWNNAVSNLSSGSNLLDYFSACGSYLNRPVECVNADMASIFSEDPLVAMKILCYNFMITRRVKGLQGDHETETVQRGQGIRDESIKSLAWLEHNHPDLLYKNLWLVPVLSRWSNLWYDSPSTGFFYYINSTRVYHLIKLGLQSDYHRGLLAKYLPKLRSKSNIKNDRHRRLNEFARGLCKYLGWSEKDYRKFKSSPENTAHLWQRQMCSNDWNSIVFNMIPGKALFNILSRKGKDSKGVLERHNLEEKYLDWIKSQPVAKFTGYPYELYNAAKEYNRTLAQRYTYDKQFDGLLEKARDSVPKELLEKGVLCALDTSGSMSMDYFMGGTQQSGVAPIDVCVGLGIYFASLIEGYFHNHVIMFDSTSKFFKMTGDSFCDKVDQIRNHATAWGGTNFSSIISAIVQLRKSNPEIPIEDYPQVLLVVSDMEFSPVDDNTETNYEFAVKQFKSVGLPVPTFIWWQVNGQHTTDVPSTIGDPGTVLVSGMDGAVVTSILGGMEKVVDKKTGELRSKNPYEVMMDCLDQEILNKVSV